MKKSVKRRLVRGKWAIWRGSDLVETCDTRREFRYAWLFWRKAGVGTFQCFAPDGKESSLPPYARCDGDK